MGFYRDQVLPRALDLSMRRGQFAQQRAQVTAGLDGEVLEIGFGTGLNIPFYPAAVQRVLAVEPAGGGRKLAARRLAARAQSAHPVPVEFVGLDADHPARRRRQPGPRAQHLDAVHDPGRQPGAGRDPPGAAAGRHAALRRAWPGA